MNKEQKEFCKTHKLTEEQFFGRKDIDGNLDLRNLTSIPQGFNPTVGWNLYLRGLISIPQGFNPTVGGNLYLSNGLEVPTKQPNKLLSWQNGKYISVDGVFTEVLHKKGNIYLVKHIGDPKEFYLISDEAGEFYAHGETANSSPEGF